MGAAVVGSLFHDEVYSCVYHTPTTTVGRR